jgi:hypothetical protein
MLHEGEVRATIKRRKTGDTWYLRQWKVRARG